MSKKNLADVKVYLDDSYYAGDFILDDSEYDELDEELNFHLPAPAKMKHLVSMGSMPKIRDEKELNRLHRIHHNSYVDLELKLDGAGVELIYEYHHSAIVSAYVLTQAISRGNTKNPNYGLDILPKIKMLRNKVPKAIHIPDTRYGNKLSIRCEYLLSNQAFAKHKTTYGWKHPRAASVGLLTSQVCGIQHMHPDLFYYDIRNELGETIKLEDKIFSLPKVPKVYSTELVEITEEQLQEYLTEYKDNFTHPIDGIVLNTHDDAIGLNGRIAYKPKKGNIKFTTLNDVVWQISRLGRLNPVGIVEPVLMEGSVVSKVTLNNIDYIKELNLKLGSVIEIQQAGEIIPEIVKNVTTPNIETEPIKVPERCPYCHYPVKHEGCFYYCTNKECKERIVKAIEYVFKDVFHLKGFGYAYCKSFVEHFDIKDTLDLFTIDLEELLNFGYNKSTNKNLTDTLFDYYKNIACKKIPLKACYMLLCLPHISATSSYLLAKHIRNIHEYLMLLEAIVSGKSIEKYSAIPNAVLKSFVLNKNKVMKMFNLLAGFIRLPKIGSLTGKTFCITGTAPKPRNDIIELIELNGGTYINNVSKKTSVLLVGKYPGKTKMAKAIKYGTPIMDLTEDIIVKMIKGQSII